MLIKRVFTCSPVLSLHLFFYQIELDYVHLTEFRLVYRLRTWRLVCNTFYYKLQEEKEFLQ